MKLQWKNNGQVEKRNAGKKATKSNETRNDRQLANILMISQF